MTALTDRARVLKRRVDLYIHQGATYRHDWVYLDEADAPIDITGYTALLQIRPHALADVLLYEGATGNGHIVIDGPDGLVQLSIPDEITGAWPWRYGEYQLDLITPGGDVDKIGWGKVRGRPDGTREA